MSSPVDDYSAMIVGAVFVLILAAIFMPLAVIWAINTLFSTTIAYTFWNWLAVFVLCGVVSPKPPLTNNKN